MIDPLIEAIFLDRFRLDGLSKSIRAALLAKVTETVHTRIFVTIAERLSPGDMARFSKVMDDGNQEQMQAFFVANVPDFMAVVYRSTLSVIEDMKRTLGKR